MKLARITLGIVCGIAIMLSAASADNLDKLKPLMKLTTPSDKGPFPVILLLSGASGFGISGGSYDEVQADLTKLGFAVLRVDSLEARGLKTYTDGTVTPSDQVDDVRVVVAYLKTQDNIKPDAINVLGWSWGGQGALAVAQGNAGITRAIAYYPACERLPSTEVKVPTLILSGEADDVVSLDICRKLVNGMKAVTLKGYPDAHHAFDNKRFDPPKKYRLGTLGYNEAAARNAWAEIEKFLAR